MDEEDQRLEEERKEKETPAVIPRRISARENKGVPPDRLQCNAAKELQEKIDQVSLYDRTIIEPKSYKEAMVSCDKLDWMEAIQQEINSQLANNS
jgi:hypothetical protein